MMNSQEMETAVRLGLNLVVLVLDDGAYGMIRWKQAVDGFADFGMTFGNPDFVRYAEAYGARGHRVGRTEDLAPTLEAAFAAGGVTWSPRRSTIRRTSGCSWKSCGRASRRGDEAAPFPVKPFLTVPRAKWPGAMPRIAPPPAPGAPHPAATPPEAPSAGGATPHDPGGAAAAAAAAAAPNPALRMDPELGLVVLEFRSAGGGAPATIPTSRELEAYRRALRTGAPPPTP
jgi:hypothetical protein